MLTLELLEVLQALELISLRYIRMEDAFSKGSSMLWRPGELAEI